MDFVRKIVNGTDLINVVDMPTSLINKKVEILVFPFEENKKKSKKKKSLAGFLAKYANQKLIEKEDNAWFEEAKE